MSHVHERRESIEVHKTEVEQKIQSLELEKRLLETDCQSLRQHARKLRGWRNTAVAIRKALRVENNELWAGKFSADAKNRALREEIEKLLYEKRKLQNEKDCLQGYFEQLEDEKREVEDDRTLLQEDLETKILLVEDDKKVLRKNLHKAQDSITRLREDVHRLLNNELTMSRKEDALQQRIQELEAENFSLSGKVAATEGIIQPNVQKFLDAKDELQRMIRDFEAKQQENQEPGLEQLVHDDHTDQDPPTQLLSPPESEHSDSSWTICDSSESELE